MHNTPFSTQLTTLRIGAQLTNKELARLAKVPSSLIAALQSGKRRIGEFQARKIGTALKLVGPQLEDFVYCAIDNCSQKILTESKSYPAELLNLLARQLYKAGILASSILGFEVNGDAHEQNVKLTLSAGQTALLSTHLNYA